MDNNFKTYLTQLIDLQETAFEKKSNVFYAHVTPTEKAVYLKISTQNCSEGAHYYRFKERFNNQTIYFTITETPKAKELLNLDGLTLEHYINYDMPICEDWFWVMAKLNSSGRKLLLEKIVTFYDNDYENYFYDKSDSLLMKQITIFEPEPRPPADFE